MENIQDKKTTKIELVSGLLASTSNDMAFHNRPFSYRSSEWMSEQAD